MKLIVVESPAKARTIERFLGGEYRVTASYGHIRDLPASAAEIPPELRGKEWARLGVDVENGYKPLYVVGKESRQRVQELKRALREADELVLATDEDREGEAISWHILDVLQPRVPVKRIAFHEITRQAVSEALANPRDVDRNLVEAQEARRILDRLFGYSLSPVLWKKIRTKLSAGRVQSVALRLIVEREEQRLRFKVSAWWDVEARITHPGGEFTARLVTVDGKRIATGKDFDPETGGLAGRNVLLLDEQRARDIAQAATRQTWRVAAIERKETRKQPQPPLITSTLQQAAASRLGFSPRRTMQIAQTLYEGIDLGGGEREGLITYMRTDSLNLSEQALAEIQDYIRGQLGERYTTGPRRYRTRSKTAQEAHEAIRPTHPARTPEQVAPYLDRDQLALYELIWRRTIASQMVPAILDRTTVDLAARIDGQQHVLRATGSVVRFPGFLAIAGTPEEETVLPELTEGEEISPGAGAGTQEHAHAVLAGCAPVRHETSPPARYNEGSLVRKLEELGIGRPSTYAPTIATILQRGYVVRKGRALVPTYVGWAVVLLLREHFDHYIDVGFTARLEDSLDEIAAGREARVRFLDRFWKGEGDQPGLAELIEQVLPRIDYPAIPVGNDPETGEPVTVRIGRRSVYLQAGEGDDSRRAVLPADLFIDELTPEKIAELLAAGEEGPRQLGTDPETGLPVTLHNGPYGPYLQLGENGPRGGKPKRVGLGRGADTEGIDLEKALRLLALPRVLGEDPETGEAVKAGLGRFGPYVVRGRTYASLDDIDQLLTVTLDEALQRIANRNRRTVLAELGTHPETGATLQVLKGRYGPYVTDGELNASLPRGTEPAEVTLDEAVALLRAAAERKRSGAGRKVKSAKKAARKKTSKKSAKKATKEKAAKKTTQKASGRTAAARKTASAEGRDGSGDAS